MRGSNTSHPFLTQESHDSHQIGAEGAVQGAGWVGGGEAKSRRSCCPQCNACRREPLLFLTLLGVLAGILLGSLIRLAHPSKDTITLIGEVLDPFTLQKWSSSSDLLLSGWRNLFL